MDETQHRVLVIAREEEARDRYQRPLTAERLDVQVETTVEAAVERVRSTPFDLVIVDASVAEVNGFDLLDALRDEDADVAIILLASANDNATILRASGVGGVCLQKPIDDETLVNAVHQRIESRRFVRGARPTVPAARLETVTASEAKNRFGRVLEEAITRGPVVITKRQRRRAVLLSFQDYADLVASPEIELDALTAEFDALLTRMQAPVAKDAARSLFSMSPTELGEAAVNVAKKRG